MVFLQTGCPFCHSIPQLQSTAVTQLQVVHYQLRSIVHKWCHFISFYTGFSNIECMYCMHIH